MQIKLPLNYLNVGVIAHFLKLFEFFWGNNFFKTIFIDKLDAIKVILLVWE